MLHRHNAVLREVTITVQPKAIEKRMLKAQPLHDISKAVQSAKLQRSPHATLVRVDFTYEAIHFFQTTSSLNIYVSSHYSCKEKSQTYGGTFNMCNFVCGTKSNAQFSLYWPFIQYLGDFLVTVWEWPK